MGMDFHSDANKYSYASRQADGDWGQAIRRIVDPAGKRVVDVGCGGGIYARAWAGLGAAQVTGVDFSAEMVAAARERTGQAAGVRFAQGTAQRTGLPDGCADVVFQRALVHHLSELSPAFTEARRLLRPGGVLIVQDRTLEDACLPGSPGHVRGYFFEVFPALRAFEAGRRPDDAAVRAAMQACGFEAADSFQLWELRRRYADFAALAEDLRGRTGRSILHELDDVQLQTLIDGIGRALGNASPIQERDRWTLWHARRPG